MKLEAKSLAVIVPVSIAIATTNLQAAQILQVQPTTSVSDTAYPLQYDTISATCSSLY